MKVALRKSNKGTPADDPAAIEAAIGELAASIAERRAGADALTADWQEAETREVAERILADQRELRRTADRDEAKLAELQTRLTAVKAAAQREAIERWRAALRALFPRLREAMEAAGRMQQEVIKVRQTALAELGDQVAAPHLPIIAFKGFLLPDLIEKWAKDTERMLSAPLRFANLPPARPRPAQPFEPAPHGTGHNRDFVQQGGVAPPAAKKPAPAVSMPPIVPPLRVPRQDPPPAEGERQVLILRGGMHHPVDSKQLAAGDIVNLPSDQAQTLLDRGIVTFPRKS